MAEIENEAYDMKSCFSPLQGAGLWSAQSQLWSTVPSLICARPLMFTGEEEEEDGVSGGMEGGRRGLELFKDEISFRDLVFLQHSAKGTVVHGFVNSYQTPVCFTLKIVPPFQLPWKPGDCDLCSHRSFALVPLCQQNISHKQQHSCPYPQCFW